MKAWLNGYGIIAALLILASAGSLLLSFMQRNADMDKIEQAASNYSAGETSSSIGKRIMYFNRALKDYAYLEAKFNPEFGTGKLFFNLANCYYQLELYPWASYYYYKAEKLLPRNGTVKRNLDAALNKLNLPPSPSNNSLFQAVFFHTRFSLPERLQIFSFFLFASLLFASLYIWAGKNLFKILAILFLFPGILLLGSILYTRYISPIEAVLVKASAIYRDAGEQYTKVAPNPLPAGLKVEVLGFRKEGKWIKIQSPEGSIGYISYEGIRLL